SFFQGKGSSLGVGRGRAVAMRARAEAAGRGRGSTSVNVAATSAWYPTAIDMSARFLSNVGNDNSYGGNNDFYGGDGDSYKSDDSQLWFIYLALSIVPLPQPDVGDVNGDAMYAESKGNIYATKTSMISVKSIG
ncbi:hypothetical protein Tco_0638570, partial [Tanacetum coccineum]